MNAFDWVVTAIVVLPFLYLTFVTLRDWLAASWRGEAVVLVPQGAGQPQSFWVQVAPAIVGLVLAVPYFYYLWIPVWRLLPPVDHWIRLFGLLLYLVGIALAFMARSALGKNWGVSTGAQARLVPGHELVQNGLYAFVRHPMYFGSWVAVMGLILVYPVWALVVLLPLMVISYLRRARREELVLSDRFGEAWTDYARRTRFMIPFVW